MHTLRPQGDRISAHTEVAQRHHRAGKTWVVMLMGTVAAGLVAAISFQFFRPEAGQAVDREAQKRAVKSPIQSQPSVAKAADTSSSNNKKYMARVGNEFIAREEVVEECMVRHQSEVLDNLINRKIIELACQEQGIRISDAEVDQEIQRTAQKFGMSVEQWYQMLQSERNVPMAHYRRDVVWPMLALKKLAGKDVDITKKDLDQAFEREYGERVKARVIVMDNIRRATEVWNKVQAHPEDFERFVKDHSVEPNSRALGGSIPPIQRYSGNPATAELEEKVFKLKAGEISSVIQVETQYYIIKCEGRTEPVVTTLEDVRDHLVEDLKERKTQQAVAHLFENIRERTRIDNYLTNQRQEGKKPGAANSGVKQVSQSGAPSGGVVPAGKVNRKADAGE